MEQINELHPDIKLDASMPDLDGFGVIENVEPSTHLRPGGYISATPEADGADAIRGFPARTLLTTS